jgi:DNA-binding NarL/FixJ family response regulator
MSWPATRHLPDAIDRGPGHSKTMTCPWFPPSVAAEGKPPGIRVLVVDDDVRVRVAIGQTIALEADLIMAADSADAAAALALADRVNPAVALVDVILPDELTGLELVRNLSRRPGCAVVAMSVRNGLRDAALAAGAVAFVEKGSDIDAILAAVRAAAPPSRP